MSSQAPPATPTKWVGVSSRGRAYEIVTIVFVSVSAISVALRLYARLRTVRKFLADDYLCIVALVFSFGLYPLAILLTETAGMGWHVTEVPPLQIERFLQLFFAAELVYGPVSLFYKLAVIFLYRNIFKNIKSFNIASWVLTGVSIAWYIGGMFSTVFQCVPVRKTWNTALPGYCIDTKAYILGNGIVNLLIDVSILVMPIPMIWNLRLSTRRRLALMGMFMIGAVVCVASIFRITTLVTINLLDATYTLFAVSLWSVVELNVGIIAACLPTLRQLVFRRRPDHTRQYYGEDYSSTKGPLESLDKSQTAVALTGWRSNAAYAEVNSSTPTPRLPQPPPFDAKNFHSSFLDTDPHSASDEDPADDKSINVRKEISVIHER